MAIDQLLAGNARFVAEDFLADPVLYARLADGQDPDVLWIGCADSRVSAETITQSPPGTIFVHRNVGNIVAFNDNNFGAVLAFALEKLRIRDIVVCGHYFCGGLGALMTGTDSPVIHDWLNMAGSALAQLRTRSDYESMDETRRMELLTEYHVRRQIRNLEQFALVQRAKPRVSIHGVIYDFRTGRLTKVLPESGSS